MPINKRFDFEENMRRFESALEKTLGNTIRKPMTAAFGYKDENGIIDLDVPPERADEPGMYYFHNYGDETGQTFVGQAFMEKECLSITEFRYGMPIRIRLDVISATKNRWVIEGPDPYLGPKYLAGIGRTVPLMELDYFAPGLLVPTTPLSMQAEVLPAPYHANDSWKYLFTLTTIDFTSAKNAVSPTKAQFVLVEINYTTGALSYQYGIQEVDDTLSISQAYFSIDQGTGIVFPDPTNFANYFMAGYIRLIPGMTVISKSNIWAVQEIFSKGAGSSSTLSAIVTSCGEVVVSGGEVVWE